MCEDIKVHDPFSTSESQAGELGTGIGTAITNMYHDHNELDPINVLSHMRIKAARRNSPSHPHHVTLEAWLSPEAFVTLEKFLAHIHDGGNALWPMPDGTWV